MIRLNVIAEGQTEKGFVDGVLAPHLEKFDVHAVARLVETKHDRRLGKVHRGGVSSYMQAKRDIQSWLKGDRNNDCRFTTMFDLYGLPMNFPEYEEARKLKNPYDRVSKLERALADDIGDRRFIPYIRGVNPSACPCEA